jgi:hypothetical protein
MTTYVRFAPKADNEQTISTCPLSADFVVEVAEERDRSRLGPLRWHSLH